MRMLSQANDLQVDGVIATIDNLKMAKTLSLTGLPAVVEPAADQIPGFPCIFDRSEAAGKICAEHLLSLGLSNFAFCGFEDFCWSEVRWEDFNKRIVDAGCNSHFYKVLRSKTQRRSDNEQVALIEWLRELPKPVGLMACNDDCGYYVMEACQVADLRVPDDVAVIGVDNDELICDLTAPPMSSVALSHETAGYRAAQLLDEIMAGKNVDVKTIIPLEASHIVIRQSTDILAIEDTELGNAIRFIRQHSGESIQVSDVVDTVTVSRRVLERRFREVLKKSIHDEIRRVRVERVVRMLLETDLSISQIALDLGYPSDKHVARYFHKEKGLTPQQYRRKFGLGRPSRVNISTSRGVKLP